jgi:hypothetical protein
VALPSFYTEFRRHKNVNNPLHMVGFLSQWKVYLDELPTGPGGQMFSGKKLDPTIFEKVCFPAIFLLWGCVIEIVPQMSDEQLAQLYELMRSTKGV